MTIGEKIKLLRIERNLTQEELAEAANTKKQTIHKYETGIISNIPASKIKLIADKLGTTPSYLMGWELNSEHAQDALDGLGPLSDEDLSFIKKYSLSSKEDKEFIRYLFSATEEEQEMFYNIIKAVKKERK